MVLNTLLRRYLSNWILKAITMVNPDTPIPDASTNPNIIWSGILGHLNDLYPATPQPRPIIPEEVRLPSYAPRIQQAYLAGRTPYRTNNASWEPTPPPVISTFDYFSALWAYFYQGYNYEQSIQLARTPTTTTSRTKAPRVADPEPYHGDREKFADFISQLHLVFNTDPEYYSQDTAKLVYTGSFIRGYAKL